MLVLVVKGDGCSILILHNSSANYILIVVFGIMGGFIGGLKMSDVLLGLFSSLLLLNFLSNLSHDLNDYTVFTYLGLKILGFSAGFG